MVNEILKEVGPTYDVGLNGNVGPTNVVGNNEEVGPTKVVVETDIGLSESGLNYHHVGEKTVGG
jgi:hypothetical protein